MINAKEIETATLEAIYWWNRDESYYHNCFSNLDNIYRNKAMLEFFTAKIFEVFLREYSIRRNLSAGHKSVNKFIDELFHHQFINGVKDGRTEIIDTLSGKIKQQGDSTKRQTKSLLSKVAFLINPNKFSLFDNLAKESVWELNKENKIFKKGELESYSFFLEQVGKLLGENDKILENQKIVLNIFKDTPAYVFFSAHPEAFNRRIIDKYLWVRKQTQNENARKINNDPYLEFTKVGNMR